MSSAFMLLCAASGCLVRGSSGAAAAGPMLNVPELPSHWTELTAASYDPEVAARAMWWSMVASYAEYELQKRKIGDAHLKDKVWLAGSNEVLMFRDGPDAYVVFRGTSTFTDVKRDVSVMTVNYRPEEENWGTSRLDAVRSMLSPWRPRMHRGFAKRIDKHFAAILVRLSKLFEDDLGCERIIFSGHSLGGAAAQGTAFLLKGWLKKLYEKLELSEKPGGASQTLYVPAGAGMSRGLNFEMAEGRLQMNGRNASGMPKKEVKIEVYCFSAPRLGNWQLKMRYEDTVPSSFNHVWGADLVPRVPPWEYEMGWQLRAVPMTLKPLKLSSRLELFRPNKLVQTVKRLHLDVVEAFLGFFDEQRDQLVKEGADKMKSDIGWLDVTEGIKGLVEYQLNEDEEEGAPKEPTRREKRLALARSSPERSTGPFKHGSEVKLKIFKPVFKPPDEKADVAGWSRRVGHVMKRMFSFMTDVAGLGFLPVAGLFLWHASRGVMDSIGPFQVDYSRFTDFQITRLFADVPHVIIGLTVPMLMIFCAEIWLSTH